MFDIEHGDSDTEANGNGLKEKDVNLQVGLLLKEYLKLYNVEV